MLIDRPQISEGSVIVNATVASGPSFPASPNEGELFNLTSGAVGFYIYSSGSWAQLASNTALTNHIADDTKHLTTAQNTLLDGLAATLTFAELNFVDGVTSPIQTQLNDIVTINTQQTTDISTHVADDTRHLTTAQNTLVDGITVPAVDINKVSGLNTLLGGSTLASYLVATSAAKLSIDGSIAMTAVLNMGTNKVSNVGNPIAPQDVATKDYVDTFVGSGGMTNPMTTAGDLIVGGASGAPSRLGIGSNGQVLKVVAGVPAWAAAPSSTMNFNSQSVDYTAALIDANGVIYHPATDATARIWTIPANSSVTFPIGTAITFDNDIGAGAITIAITSDTLVLVGPGTTGNRTLAAGGQATALKVDTTRWRISGTGLS